MASRYRWPVETRTRTGFPVRAPPLRRRKPLRSIWPSVVEFSTEEDASRFAVAQRRAGEQIEQEGSIVRSTTEQKDVEYYVRAVGLMIVDSYELDEDDD